MSLLLLVSLWLVGYLLTVATVAALASYLYERIVPEVVENANSVTLRFTDSQKGARKRWEFVRTWSIFWPAVLLVGGLWELFLGSLLLIETGWHRLTRRPKIANSRQVLAKLEAARDEILDQPKGLDQTFKLKSIDTLISEHQRKASLALSA